MDVLFTSSDLDLKHFAKQNDLFSRNSDGGKIRLVIEDFMIKFNKNLLTKNFHFFKEKIHKEKNNKNECLNILNHLDIGLFAKEDVDFLKSKFFHFINFLFLNSCEKNESKQNFKMKINELIKFIEICIIFEPSNLIIDKIHKIIFLNPKIKTAIEANSNKPGGSFIKEKLDFLMQKLQSQKNFCKSNPITKLEKANLSGFGLNASNISEVSAKSHSNKSVLNQSFNLDNSVNSTSNVNLNLNKSGGKLPKLLSNLGDGANAPFMPNYSKNSIFFRYSFNLIRHLYDLPLALNLKNKSAVDKKQDKGSNMHKNLNDNNNNNNNTTNNNCNQLNLNSADSKKIQSNELNNIKKIDSFSFNCISNERLKTLSSYNQPILEKNGNSHGPICFNKHQNEGGGGGGASTSIYLFNNASLEEETKNYFSRKNRGFFAFVDSLFSNQNCWFARLFGRNQGNVNINNNYECNDNKNKELLFDSAFAKRNKIGLMPNKNYIRNLGSLTSISDEYSTQMAFAANISNNKFNNNNNNNNNNHTKKDIFEKSIKKPAKHTIKKSLENILLKEYTESNKELSRFFLEKNLQNFDLRCEKAIQIQKHFRRYLSYKNYLLKIKDYLKFKLISSIGKIQAFYRGFIWRKKIKYKLLLKEILRSRLHSSIRIFFALRKFYCVKKLKQNFLILQIIQNREKACTHIQTNFRRFSLRKFFKEFLLKENNFFKITYPFKAEKVQLKLYIPRPIDEKKGSFEIFSDEKILNFEFCNFRKIHVLYIDNYIIKPGKYRALMLVDGITTCDGRYPHVEFSDGFYYNIIDVKESANEERKVRSKKNVNERSQYYMSKYGNKAQKNDNKDNYVKFSDNKIISGVRNENNFNFKKDKNNNNNKKVKIFGKEKGKENFFIYSSSLNKNNNNNFINQFANVSKIDAVRLANFNYHYNTNDFGLKNYNNKNTNAFLNQGPNYSQFPHFIAGADLTTNNNNYLRTLTDSNNNVNTGASLKEEHLETRNTWENKSYFSSSSSNVNSQKTNNSNSNSKKNLKKKSNLIINEENNNKKTEVQIENYQKNNLRQDSCNTFNSNLTNNEDNYFNEWIYNYNELRRNLLPNENNTKTVSCTEKLRQCVKDESDAFNSEISN